jgi:hypothetical protein
VTRLEEFVDALLWEGYALYPYTPGATKNATPTPFGIVYPPAYAAGSPHTFDRLKLQCIATNTELVSATIAFLEPSGPRHEGVERRIELTEPGPVEFAFDAVRGRAELTLEPFDIDGIARVTVAVENTTPVPEGLDRGAALRAAMLSTHVVVRADHGRFFSPIAPPDDVATAVMTCANVNTFPVLATPADDAILGAAIMLPDHPQLAPESRGGMFDSTEIEEALLLHVMALSDAEREQATDPAVRAMIERVATTTPAELMALHGRVTVRDPEQGEREAVVDGVTYRRGDTVVLRPAANATPQDHLVAGRAATIERIYHDYDGTVHLAVTVDDVPGQDMMRDIGRYLYFKTSEVEVA